MDNTDLITAMIGVSILGVAALLFLVGLLLSRTKREERANEKELLRLKTIRDASINEAIANPCTENVKEMWERIDEYDRQRTAGT